MLYAAWHHVQPVFPWLQNDGKQSNDRINLRDVTAATALEHPASKVLAVFSAHDEGHLKVKTIQLEQNDVARDTYHVDLGNQGN